MREQSGIRLTGEDCTWLKHQRQKRKKWTGVWTFNFGTRHTNNHSSACQLRVIVGFMADSQARLGSLFYVKLVSVSISCRSPATKKKTTKIFFGLRALIVFKIRPFHKLPGQTRWATTQVYFRSFHTKNYNCSGNCKLCRSKTKKKNAVTSENVAMHTANGERGWRETMLIHFQIKLLNQHQETTVRGAICRTFGFLIRPAKHQETILIVSHKTAGFHTFFQCLKSRFRKEPSIQMLPKTHFVHFQETD